uniref:Cl17799_1 n=1 Tax=Arundo donax TaxID=35708 RepID=A0A0A9F1J2_ARUDO
MDSVVVLDVSSSLIVDSEDVPVKSSDVSPSLSSSNVNTIAASSSWSSSTASWRPKPPPDLLGSAGSFSSGAKDRRISHVDPAPQTAGSAIEGGGFSTGGGRTPLIPPSPAALFTSGRVGSCGSSRAGRSVASIGASLGASSFAGSSGSAYAGRAGSSAPSRRSGESRAGGSGLRREKSRAGELDAEERRTALCASQSASGMAKSSGPESPRVWQRSWTSPPPSPLAPMRKLETRSREQAADPASEVGPEAGAEAGGDGG